jgi:hypothetical protein
MNPATDWIDQARRVLDALAGTAGSTPDAEGTPHGSDCRWCPICQVAAVVRGERPEVTAGLADVLTATASALRTFAAAAEGSTTSAPGDDEAESGDPPPPVQQIEIA